LEVILEKVILAKELPINVFSMIKYGNA